MSPVQTFARDYGARSTWSKPLNCVYPSSREIADISQEDEQRIARRRPVEATNKHTSSWKRITTLTDLSVKLPKGDLRFCLDNAIEIAHSLGATGRQGAGLAFLVCRLGELGYAEWAAELTSSIDDPESRARASVCVAEWDASLDSITAISTARSDHHPVSRAELLLTIAGRASPRSGRAGCAGAAVDASTPSRSKCPSPIVDERPGEALRAREICGMVRSFEDS